jgi:serine/threonine protein kinase
MKLVENTVVAGRFRLNRLLGRGGMGSVWHATHLGLDVPCAVKFIEGTNALAPEAQARFEREAKSAAQLRSPHVVQIFDHGICDGTPYIAMELLDGEDLGKRLMRLQRLPASVLCPIVGQVCRALTRAHQLGIVHRDLKPDNIFLVHDDEREIAKVLDFGIAKDSSHALGGGNTRTGALLGTPHYMSPEQAQGIKQVDFRSDLWSLAVICFRALTGQLPFKSEALGDLLVKIIVAPIPVPSESGPVPEGFDGWWSRAAQRDVALRFQSAKDFAESLSVACGISSRGSVEIPVRVLSQTTALPTLLKGAASQGAGVAVETTPEQTGAEVAPLPGTAAPITRTFDPPLTGPSVTLMAIAGVVLAAVVVAVGGFALWKTAAPPDSGAQPASLASPVAPRSSASAPAQIPEVPPSSPPATAAAADSQASPSEPAPVAKPANPHRGAHVTSAPKGTAAPSKVAHDLGF